MTAPDTSIVIAAAATWHSAHRAAVEALSEDGAVLLVRVAYEATAALSRMPSGQRVPPDIVLEWLEQRFADEWLGLPAAASRTALRAAVARGIRGGALYDALIGATAAHHGHRLVTADRRAVPAYDAVGADVVFVDAG
ncbi:MAG TPA: PIN domain-containing protein [Solirubrobacteraceae bacterium]|nr:PIN domain-containing protein [Solirubrobacteraceae bacterium]